MNEIAISTSNLSESIKLNRYDLIWIFSLFGTAIGAGTLFLPINVGIGGIIPMIIMGLLAFPMTFYAHRGLTRFVLSGASNHSDITEVVEEHFGVFIGKWITLLYFFAIYPILLVYSVAITNTVSSFIEYQLQMSPPSRPVLAAILILTLMTIVHSGKDFTVRALSLLVFPFLISLIGFALYLIPNWNTAIFTSMNHIDVDLGDFAKTLWLAIPVMVFSFNHSPIISSFAVDQKKKYGKDADLKSRQILFISHLMMVFTVLFFVFSSVLSLTPHDLMLAKEQNISILSYLANHFNNPIIAYCAPLIAFVAISKSFLGHYLGASEGLNGLMTKALRTKNKQVPKKLLDRITMVLIGFTAWIVATLNPNILGMIENLGGPVIAILLFLMPMYAIYRVPVLRKYANKFSDLFVILIGCIAISAILYNLLS